MEKIKVSQKQVVKLEKLLNELAALTSSKIILGEVSELSSEICEIKDVVESKMQSKASEFIGMFDIEVDSE